MTYWGGCCGTLFPAGTVPTGHGASDDVVPAFDCVEFPTVAEEVEPPVGFAGFGLAGFSEVPGVAGVFGFAFCPVFGFAGVEVLALFETAGVGGLTFDPPCAAAVATGTHGIPFGFDTAPVWPLAGIEEFGCAPVCVAGPAVVCTSFPAALVVIGVGGPIVVIWGVVGVLGGAVAVGGAVVGVDAPGPAGGGGAAGVVLFCAKTQLPHIREITNKKTRVDTETSGESKFRDEFFP